VKFFSTNYSYDYPFSTVTLAYFLRYPNPYSRHVLSTDVIEREFDPITQRLYTTRLHLKRSRLPSAILKLLPRALLGASSGGDSQTYILERTVVDVKEGWMKTESRNLEFTTVLDVIEKQIYRRGSGELTTAAIQTTPNQEKPSEDRTDVNTTVALYSHLGQRFKRTKTATGSGTESSDEEANAEMGFLRRWSQTSLQRSIEAIGLNRTSKSQPNAKEGMKVVLERLRQGGLVAVLEGMRQDREGTLGGGVSAGQRDQ
jgi:4-amino-4-deoxychorismate lyase